MAAVGMDFSLTRSLSTDSTDSSGMRSIPEPVNRTPVEKVAAPEIAKSVRRMFETGEIPDRHEIIKTVATLEEESTESGVFENQPVQIEGVVRSGDYVNDVDEVLQKGATRNLLDQWKDKGREEFRADKGPINLAEDEGRVLESEPVRRDDVYREEDTDYTKDLPAKGQAKMLTEHWVTRKDEFQKDQRPIKLCENDSGEPSVVENQPEVRTDVLREEDSVEEIWLRKGFTRNLAGFWAAPKEDPRTGRDCPIDLGSETDGGVIAENEPAKLDESVVRSDYSAEEVLPIQKGSARSMVSKWQTRPEEPDRQPFQLDVNPDEVGVYENDPIQLEGVVRCGSQTDDVLGQKGMIKNIAGKFLQTDEGPKSRREMIVIDLADGPAVLENDPEPVRADVVRSEYNPDDEVQVERGTTRNLVQRWKNQDLEQMTSSKSMRPAGEDPAWILEAEKAAESGVFENQPDVRTDVFREVDYEPEMISTKNTRNTRELWTRMGQEDGRKGGRAPEVHAD